MSGGPEGCYKCENMEGIKNKAPETAGTGGEAVLEEDGIVEAA